MGAPTGAGRALEEPSARNGPHAAVRLTKGERTKRRLMDATAALLSEKGYQATRIEDIAAAADVAKGTFYLYFKNKKAVTLAVMEEFLVQGEQYLLASRTLDDPFLEILEPTASYTRLVFEQAGLLQAFVQFSHSHPDAARLWSESTSRWLVRVDAAMDRRLGAGSTDAEARMLVVFAMSWMVDGVLLSFLTRDHPQLQRVVHSPEQLAETLSVLWYRAVYGEDPDPKQLASGRKILDFRLARSRPSAGRRKGKVPR